VLHVAGKVSGNGRVRPANVSAVDASAVDARPSLDWRAPAECIRAAELSRAVTAELGSPAFAPGGQSETVVHGRVVRTASGFYRVDVSLERVSGGVLGVRSLESDSKDCRSLDEATAVMLAIMLNVSKEEIAASEPSPWSLDAGLTLSGVVGLLPRPGADVALHVGPSLPHTVAFALELGADVAPRRARGEGHVTAWVASSRVTATPVLAWGPGIELAVRLAAGGGLMTATTDGFSRVGSARRALVDLRAGPRLGFRVARSVWLGVGGDAGFLPLRPGFLVANPDGTKEELFRPSVLFGTFGLTLSLRPR
jgi:hypothetical protein